MSEKTTLLPSAPQDERFTDGTQQPPGGPQTAIPMPRIVLAPGLEFDSSRKYRYGLHSLMAAILIFLGFILVEFRDCNWGIGIDLDRLQALHVSLMVFALGLYLLSLFGIADFIFQYKVMFLFGVIIIYSFVGLMVWMTYEAAVNHCASSTLFPVGINISADISFAGNVFSRKDGVGIVVLFLDAFATLLMFSAATSFYKRY